MDEALKIDWTLMPTYNTIMAVAAGAGMVSLVPLGWRLAKGRGFSAEGYAVNFGVLGLILTITGAHMTLTWPFAAYFPFDNIIFGEPSLAFGVLLLAGSVLLWKRAAVFDASPQPGRELARMLAPLTVFILGVGLSLIAIAVAGVVYQLFAAPPEEPISGAFAQWPWVEATFMSGLFALAGIGTLALPAAARDFARDRGGFTVWQYITGIALGVSGVVFVLFGAMNFFTHIGLIVHTM